MTKSRTVGEAVRGTNDEVTGDGIGLPVRDLARRAVYTSGSGALNRVDDALSIAVRNEVRR